jgi:CBS domain-containing protein
MIATEKAFLDLTAEDLMSDTVQVVPQGMPLRTAADVLARAHISGAPVVDAEGRCVGVLSATDFVNWARDQHQLSKAPPGLAGCVCSEWQVMDFQCLPNDEVRWYMTSDPVMVAPAVRITDLARMMLDAHIHRVIVVDQMLRPVGIVSSTDVLAAVAYMEKVP